LPILTNPQSWRQKNLPHTFRSIWFVGGSELANECLRLGPADEIRYTILPIVIGDGIRFFQTLNRDIELHLTETRAHTNGMVELRYQVRRSPTCDLL